MPSIARMPEWLLVVFTAQPHEPPARPPGVGPASKVAAASRGPASPGPASGMPASETTQVPVETTQTRPPVQSSFESQSPQTPLGAQIDERQTSSPAHVSPLGRPQRSSSSKHTPLMQVRVPMVSVHMPLAGPAAGTDMPFGTCGAQTRLSGHHCPSPQSASTLQAVPHEPLVRSQSGPPVWPSQSALVVQRPQMPIVAPVNAQ